MAVILMGLGIWILVAAVGAPGPAFARVGVAAIGLSLSAAGLWFGVRAVGAFGRRGADEDYSLRVKERAEQLGLPTEPEAYQDGGVGVAATGRTTTEAELIAAELNARDIPAWVDQAYTSTVLWHAQFALNPGGVRVLVPLGRLADARRVVDETRGQEGTSEEDEEPAEGRRFGRTGASLILLLGGLWVTLLAILISCSAAARGPEPVEVVLLILMGFLGLAATIVGILGLRAKPKPQD